MEKSAEKWGSGGRRRPLVGVRGWSWSFLTKIRRKNRIKQPCIFQFCQFLTWCKTITFWFERTILCFGVDTFLFQRKSADPQPIPTPVGGEAHAASQMCLFNKLQHRAETVQSIPVQTLSGRTVTRVPVFQSLVRLNQLAMPGSPTLKADAYPGHQGSEVDANLKTKQTQTTFLISPTTRCVVRSVELLLTFDGEPCVHGNAEDVSPDVCHARHKVHGCLIILKQHHNQMFTPLAKLILQSYLSRPQQIDLPLFVSCPASPPRWPSG